MSVYITLRRNRRVCKKMAAEKKSLDDQIDESQSYSSEIGNEIEHPTQLSGVSPSKGAERPGNGDPWEGLTKAEISHLKGLISCINSEEVDPNFGPEKSDLLFKLGPHRFMRIVQDYARNQGWQLWWPMVESERYFRYIRRIVQNDESPDFRSTKHVEIKVRNDEGVILTGHAVIPNCGESVFLPKNVLIALSRNIKYELNYSRDRDIVIMGVTSLIYIGSVRAYDFSVKLTKEDYSRVASYSSEHIQPFRLNDKRRRG